MTVNRLLSTLGAGGAPAPGGGNGAVLNRTVFVSLLATDGDGSADAPFGLLSEAVAACPDGGTFLVTPGNYSADTFVLDASKPYVFRSTAGPLSSANGQVQQVEFPLFPSFSAAGSAGGALHFEGIGFTGSHDVAATGMQVVYVGCHGIVTNGAFVWIMGGGAITLDASVNNAVIEHADLFNSVLAAQSAVHLHNCNSWGQSLSVSFPVASPPGCFCYYDATTKGNATNAAPTVTDGEALFLGLPLQTISLGTVDEVIQALVNLGLFVDTR